MWTDWSSWEKTMALVAVVLVSGFYPCEGLFTELLARMDYIMPVLSGISGQIEETPCIVDDIESRIEVTDLSDTNSQINYIASTFDYIERQLKER